MSIWQQWKQYRSIPDTVLPSHDLESSIEFSIKARVLSAPLPCTPTPQQPISHVIQRHLWLSKHPNPPLNHSPYAPTHNTSDNVTYDIFVGNCKIYCTTLQWQKASLKHLFNLCWIESCTKEFKEKVSATKETKKMKKENLRAFVQKIVQ